MKKALLIASVLFIAVISTACINNIAVQELNNKAAEYMQKGDYDSAINRLQASIDLDSSMFETYYNLGIAATNAKKFELAIESFENGIKIKPSYPDFYYSLAVAQAEYAKTILESDEKALESEAKMKAEDLENSAILNAEKYLELASEAEDREDVEEFINSLKEEEKEESQKVLKG